MRSLDLEILHPLKRPHIVMSLFDFIFAVSTSLWKKTTPTSIPSSLFETPQTASTPIKTSVTTHLF